MTNHKGKSSGTPRGRLAARLILRLTLALAPLSCLAAYVAGSPFPLPAFMVPERRYEGVSTADALADAAVAGGLSVPLIALSGPLGLEDARAGLAFFRLTGRPVRFEPRPAAPGPLAAYSIASPGAGAQAMLSVLIDEAGRGGPAKLLYASPGAAVVGDAARGDAVPGETRTLASAEPLPRDARLSAPLPPTPQGGGASTPLALRLEAGGRASDFLAFHPSGDERRILLVTRKTARRSVLEALRPVRGVGYEELLSAGAYGYELIVLDGPILAELDGAPAAFLADYVRRGAGSLLLAIDSPELGKAGDAPALEAILPVEPAPRALERLPDVAMVVAIDVSGSMYGDKLALAKAVGLELVANLKDSDLAGVLLFDEDSSWLYPLAPLAGLDARAGLGPLRAGGGTALGPALLACLEALESSSMPERRLVVVSDGISAPADFDALAARAFRSRIAISAMAVGAEYDRATLTRLSAGSGGRFYRVADASEVPSLIVADRRELSRTVFAEERVAVVDLTGAPAGYVEGMARLGLAPEATAFFSSAAGDPLLSSRRVGTRATIAYASDLYGRYGRDFLARPQTLATLDAMLMGLLSEAAPALTLTETSDGLSASLRADYLVEPSALLTDARGRVAHEGLLERVAPGRFYVGLGRPSVGAYTLLVSDRGRSIARVPVYSNGGTAARPSDSEAAARAYRPSAWVMTPRGEPWLVAFFALSLCLTLARRLDP